MSIEKIILTASLLIGSWITSFAQKPAITDTTLTSDNWNSLFTYSISPDGAYACYADRKGLHVTNATGKEIGFYRHAGTANFTNDSKLIITLWGDLLYISNLAKNITDTIKEASQLVVPASGIDNIIAYKKEGRIVIKNLKTKEEKSFDGTTGIFNPQGDVFITTGNNKLFAYNLATKEEIGIESDAPVQKIALDESGYKIAYVIADSTGATLKYFDLKAGRKETLIAKQTLPEGQTVQTSWGDKLAFSPDGKHLYFFLNQLQPAKTKQADVISTQVDIWSYKDKWPKTLAFEKHLSTRNLLAVVSLENKKVSVLENNNFQIKSNPGNRYLIGEELMDRGTTFWNKKRLTPCYLVDIITGDKKVLIADKGPIGSADPFITSDDQFAVWFDTKSGNYISYEIKTGIQKNISETVDEPLYTHTNGLQFNYPKAASLRAAGILPESQQLMVYGRNDLWLLDLFGKKTAVNITGGYGRKNNIVFRPFSGSITDGKMTTYKSNDIIHFLAFDKNNYQNGFWQARIGESKAPVKLTMDDALYSFESIVFGPLAPKKAKNANVFLVSRQTASESPNLYITKDLKKFIKLSDIHPEKNYNWLTSELITWKVNDTLTCKGVLYKPENFDPNKKYPVIFNYYELESQELHLFRQPEISLFSIPWYVSNGYVVFRPDMHFSEKHTARASTTIAVSAAKHLSQFQWVNMQKLGLQGHSFGGYQTNAIIANTNIFAAAQEGAGVANASSDYNAVGHGKPPFNGGSRTFMYEVGQMRLNTTPWESPEIYIENSPVFQAHKIETPLLIMHNKGDGPVSFFQGMEMYNVLARLEKPVWLLQYDDSQHLLDSPESEKDFWKRQSQFFDHYLKDKPAPLWMVEGISDLDKGIISGFELDNRNRKP